MSTESNFDDWTLDRIGLAKSLARWALTMNGTMEAAEADDFAAAYRSLANQVFLDEAAGQAQVVSFEPYFWQMFDQGARLMDGLTAGTWTPAIERISEAPGWRRARGAAA